MRPLGWHFVTLNFDGEILVEQWPGDLAPALGAEIYLQPPAVTGTGAVSISAPAVAASGTVTPPGDITASGAVSVQRPTVDGSGSVSPPSITASGAVSVQRPTVDGAGSVSLPSITASGAVSVQRPTIDGSGSVSLPTITAAGALAVSAPNVAGFGIVAPPGGISASRALAALASVLGAATAVEVIRNSDRPEAVPAAGLITLNDGSQAVVDEVFSPLRYHVEHIADVVVLAQTEAKRDQILKVLSDALVGNRTLGGAVEFLQLRAVSLDPADFDGAEALRCALMPVALHYTTMASPVA
jgi:hypothetical protein